MANEISVIPLGTVSPKPTLENNGPGILVKIGTNNILLDCGDGVSRMLKDEDLRKLSIIISHFHLDHYIGLGTLAYQGYVNNNLGLLDDRIKVYYPKNKISIPGHDSTGWATDNYEDTMNVFKWLLDDIEYFNYEYYDNYKEFDNNDYKISFHEGLHEPQSYLIKIKTPDVNIVYSGDTGYSNDLIDFINGADLFICESSYYRGIPKNNNHHLYAYEAAKLAKLSDVKQLMLTHFYPGVDKNIYLNEAKEVFTNTIVAEEGKKLILKRGNNE